VQPLEKPRELLVIHKDSHFLDHVDNGYYFAIRSGVEEEAARIGLVCRFVPLSRLEEETLHRYAGVLVIGNHPPEVIERICHAVGTRDIVFIGKLNFLPEGFDTITYDVEECVRLALFELLDNGLHDVLFVDGKDRCMIPRHCLKISYVRSFVATHPQMHLVDYLEVEEGFGSEAGYHAIKEYVSTRKQLPEAIFTATDPLGIGVTKACNELHVQIGKDVSIVSINGDNSGQWVSPALTTVDFHARLMGVEAVRIANANENDAHHVTKCVFFKPDLIKGDSVRLRDGASR